jgi:hypothetical protein
MTRKWIFLFKGRTMRKCLNCGYERHPEDESDIIPASECPKCRAIYGRVEKWNLKKEYEAAAQSLAKYEKAKKPLTETGEGKGLLKAG